MNARMIARFAAEADEPQATKLPYKEMGRHPEGGAFTSFHSDADAQRAWAALSVKTERRQLVLRTATTDPMIRILPASPVTA